MLFTTCATGDYYTWVETYIRSAGDSMSYSTLERNENHVQPRHPTLHMIVKRVYKLETSFFSSYNLALEVDGLFVVIFSVSLTRAPI